MTQEKKLTILYLFVGILIVSLLANLCFLIIPKIRKAAFDLGASQAFFATGREIGRGETIDGLFKIVDENGFVNVTNSQKQTIKLIPDEQ